MDKPIIYIEPERLARWKRRFPIHWRRGLDSLEAGAIIRSGKASPEFTREACFRAWDLLLSISPARQIDIDRKCEGVSG